jgi:hypothetical protein
MLLFCLRKAGIMSRHEGMHCESELIPGGLHMMKQPKAAFIIKESWDHEQA